MLLFSVPNKVVKLSVTMQTNTSITLSWDRPEGNVDLYRVQYNGTEQNTSMRNVNTSGTKIDGLNPATLYRFIVCSGVNDISKWSDESTVNEYTSEWKSHTTKRK